jgi:mono/diheme cytochrome c family protein
MQQWDEPVLGYNRRNRIAPFMPGGQAILTHIDAQGKEVVSNGTVETSAGLYGFSMSPVQPHNITLESRTCTSCHSSKRALGLGGDLMDLKALGLPLNFSPDRIVDEEGFRIQDSAHDGVRPFDRDDLANVFRTGACITCHEDAAGPRDAAADTPVTLEGADEHHHTLMNEASKPKER